MADQPLYEVEKLLGRKVLPNKCTMYLVRWKGFSSDHDSWEPYTNLQKCKPLISIYKRSLKDGDTNSLSNQTSRTDFTASEEAVENKTPGRKRGRKKKLPLPEDGGDLAIKKAAKKSKFSEHLKKSKYLAMLRNKTMKTKTDEDKSLAHSEVSEKLTDMNSTNQISRDVSKPGRKGFKRRKLEPDGSDRGSKTTYKKKKKPDSENINQLNGKDTEDILNIGVNSEDDDDDSGILYSLNRDCDIANLDDVTNKDDFQHKRKNAKVRTNTGHPKSVITKKGSSMHSQKGTRKDGGKKKSKILLMDSKKTSKDLLTKSGLMHSPSIPPMFTTVKHLVDSPDSQNPTGNCHQKPVSPEASETYLADVPSAYPVPAEEPHSSEQSHSPRSLSYNSLLNSLPGQLHLSHKNGNKKSTSSSNTSVGSLDTDNINPTGALVTTSVGGEQVERRTSVRSTECAFRYKQIVVKKCVHYTQIWLNTQTVMKNALNPQVIQEVVSALNSAKYDDSHLVLFSSLGNVFCSGTDLHFLVSGDRKMSARQMADAIRELTKTIITFPKPIIAAVSGAAVGLGMSLLALCDVVYASDKASFHLPYSQLSQTPEGCSSFTLPLTLGLPSANELLFGGRKITAMEAYQLGLVSQVFWPTLMMQEVIPRAQHMATCSAKALEATKLLVRSHHRTKMELTNETECNLLLERWLSVDCQRAIEAYLSNEKNLAF